MIESEIGGEVLMRFIGRAFVWIAGSVLAVGILAAYIGRSSKARKLLGLDILAFLLLTCTSCGKSTVCIDRTEAKVYEACRQTCLYRGGLTSWAAADVHQCVCRDRSRWTVEACSDA